MSIFIRDFLEKSRGITGEHELAAFAAMREVEIRVRELSNASESLIGVKLMTEVSRDSGLPTCSSASSIASQVAS